MKKHYDITVSHVGNVKKRYNDYIVSDFTLANAFVIEKKKKKKIVIIPFSNVIDIEMEETNARKTTF